MILYGSSLSDGHEHSAKNLPLLLACGAARSIRPGWVLGDHRDTSMSNLHLAILQRLGIPEEGLVESDSALDLA